MSHTAWKRQDWILAGFVMDIYEDENSVMLSREVAAVLQKMNPA